MPETVCVTRIYQVRTESEFVSLSESVLLERLLVYGTVTCAMARKNPHQNSHPNSPLKQLLATAKLDLRPCHQISWRHVSSYTTTTPLKRSTDPSFGSTCTASTVVSRETNTHTQTARLCTLETQTKGDTATLAHQLLRQCHPYRCVYAYINTPR